jgi:protein-L-isoaspartate(D-aspartate) O-methyltransferase
VLAELAGRVYSVEIIDDLARRAIQRLKRQGYTNVGVRVGNGYAGWPEHAPFDKVMVTAAPDLIPPPLINQLRDIISFVETLPLRSFSTTTSC